MTEMHNETVTPAMAKPFAQPLYVMAKPVGAACDMWCNYCYYRGKWAYKEHQQKMDLEMLELFTRQYIEAQTQREVLFTWHGGEPMMRGINFFYRALMLQQKYGKGHGIDNCIQTNGTFIDEGFCDLFSNHGWLVGVSIDGDESMHDANRHFNDGSPTFKTVMQGIEMLDRFRVHWNAMATVNSENVRRPLDFYRFFKNIGCRYLQFTPIVELVVNCLLPIGKYDKRVLHPATVTPEAWGDFLCAVFDEWVRNDVGTVFVQLFDATLANLCGVPPGVCSMSATCSNALVLEANGDVYSCDHFVYPPFRLGNIRETPLATLAYSRRQTAFRDGKKILPRRCRECRWLQLCHGECPRNRIMVDDADGERGINYLCEGYHRFFEHSAPYFAFMKAELDAGRAPANVMRASL